MKTKKFLAFLFCFLIGGIVFIGLFICYNRINDPVRFKQTYAVELNSYQCTYGTIGSITPSTEAFHDTDVYTFLYPWKVKMDKRIFTVYSINDFQTGKPVMVGDKVYLYELYNDRCLVSSKKLTPSQIVAENYLSVFLDKTQWKNLCLIVVGMVIFLFLIGFLIR